VIHFPSRENTILRSKLAPRVGGSIDDLSDPFDDDYDDSDSASSTECQDHERPVSKFGLDPGRVYVIPNAIVADKFKPSPQGQTGKGGNKLMGHILPY
jgi:hypothetical protein